MMVQPLVQGTQTTHWERNQKPTEVVTVVACPNHPAPLRAYERQRVRSVDIALPRTRWSGRNKVWGLRKLPPFTLPPSPMAAPRPFRKKQNASS